MAYEILDELVIGGSATRVTHATHHDLESLIYTLSYATYRYVHKGRDLEILPAMTSEERKLFNAEFEKFFGRVSVSDILDARKDLILRQKSSKDRKKWQRVYNRVPDHVSALCQVLLTRLSKQYPELAAPSFVTEELAVKPVIARLRKLDPRQILLDDNIPPPEYLTCADVKQTITSLIAVYLQSIDPSLGVSLV